MNRYNERNDYCNGRRTTRIETTMSSEQFDNQKWRIVSERKEKYIQNKCWYSLFYRKSMTEYDGKKKENDSIV